MGEEILNPKEFGEFTGFIKALQKRNLERLEEEINWFNPEVQVRKP